MCELQKECEGQGSLPSDARRTDSGSVVLGEGHLATSATARRSGETMSKPPVEYGAKPLPLDNFPVLSGLQDAYSVRY